MLNQPTSIAVLLGAAAIHFSLLVVIHTAPATNGRRGWGLTAFLAAAGLYLVSIATVKLFVHSVWFGVLRTENFLALIAYRSSLVLLMVDVAGVRRNRRILNLIIYGAAAILAILVIGDGPHWFSLGQFGKFSAELKQHLFAYYWVAVWAEGILNVAAVAPLVWFLRHARRDDPKRRLVTLLIAATLLMIAYFGLQAFVPQLFVSGGLALFLACETSSVLVSLLIAYYDYRYLFVSRFLRWGVATMLATIASVMTGAFLMTRSLSPGLVAVYTAAVALVTAWGANLGMGVFLRRSDRAVPMRERALQLLASAPAESAGTELAQVLGWGFDAGFAEYTPAGEWPRTQSEVRLEIPVRSGQRSFGVLRLGTRRHDAPYEPYDADCVARRDQTRNF